MSENIKQEILSLLKPEQLVFLATSLDHQPSVRPMTMIYNKELFFFATGTADAKTAQIASNPWVEICMYFRDEKYAGYVRAKGKLVNVTDAQTRKEIFEEASFLNCYWKEPTDPSYVLYQMSWTQVEYMKPGENNSVRIDWI